MIKKPKQSKRMGQYTNLGRVRRTNHKARSKSAKKYPKPIAWFLGLSWPKRLLFIAGIGIVLLMLVRIKKVKCISMFIPQHHGLKLLTLVDMRLILLTEKQLYLLAQMLLQLGIK